MTGDLPSDRLGRWHRPAATVDELAEAVLVAHQRKDFGSCLCGWSELGRSHPRHQVAKLHEAALLKDRLPELPR